MFKMVQDNSRECLLNIGACLLGQYKNHVVLPKKAWAWRAVRRNCRRATGSPACPIGTQAPPPDADVCEWHPTGGGVGSGAFLNGGRSP